MTSIRLRFDILWTIPAAMIASLGPAENHIALARRVLEDNFAADRPKASFTPSLTETGDTLIAIHWDISLREAPGAFYDPADHVAYIERRLVTTFKPRYAPFVSVETWRHASFAEAVDHGEIATHYGADNTTKDDYPVFRPETHADWPEANEVFLLEGAWWWSDTTEAFPSPAVGPDPVAIYTRWDPAFRTRLPLPPHNSMAATLAGAIAGALAS
jgi:hypothetical protein